MIKLVKFLPDLVRVISLLVGAIRVILQERDRALRKKRIKDALSIAKTGDTSELENIIRDGMRDRSDRQQ